MRPLIKVGLDYILDNKNKQRRFTYNDIKYEPGKWADASKYLPADYDLVFIKYPNQIKTKSAWCIGRKWDGLNIHPDQNVLYWKKNVEF